MEKINEFTKNNGNCILIVKGTETGILALKDIIDGILNFVETSGKVPKIVTDDNPLVYLGFCDFDIKLFLINQLKL